MKAMLAFAEAVLVVTGPAFCSGCWVHERGEPVYVERREGRPHERREERHEERREERHEHEGEH